MKKWKYAAIEKIETSEDVVVEYNKGKETRIFFYDSTRITPDKIRNLLLNSFERSRPQDYVGIITKRDMLGMGQWKVWNGKRIFLKDRRSSL